MHARSVSSTVAMNMILVSTVFTMTIWTCKSQRGNAFRHLATKISIEAKNRHHAIASCDLGGCPEAVHVHVITRKC